MILYIPIDTILDPPIFFELELDEPGLKCELVLS